uniref:DUF1758 domain-containing protein n=1 Tax=Anopheles funestus TaxID=62324 RepID=A0A182RME9_ANOFN
MAVTRPTVSCGVLSTALVRIKSRSGELFEARALLDNGSQVNILTERLCKKLNLIRHSSEVKLIGIGHCEVSGVVAGDRICKKNGILSARLYHAKSATSKAVK